MYSALTIHLFTRESNYSTSFIKFLAEHFDITNHIFVFRYPRNQKIKYPDKIHFGQILFIDSKVKFLFKLLPMAIQARSIYFHFLPIGITPIFWLILPGLLSKTSWMLWGDDLYWIKTGKIGIKALIFDYIRGRLIRKIPRILAFMEGDYKIAKEIYNTKAKYQYAVYPIPTDFDYLEKIRQKPSIPHIKTILVGHSANPLNKHIEIFKILKGQISPPYNIICPLSYGGNSIYIEEVVTAGKNMFGEQFIPILTMLPPWEYSEYLSKVDVAIFHAPRQLGLGNILSLLFLGKKVYLNPDTTPWQYFQKIGVKVYNSFEISNLDSTDFFEFLPKYSLNNYKIIKEHFNDEVYVDMWKNVFDNEPTMRNK